MREKFDATSSSSHKDTHEEQRDLIGKKDGKRGSVSFVGEGVKRGDGVEGRGETSSTDRSGLALVVSNPAFERKNGARDGGGVSGENEVSKKEVVSSSKLKPKSQRRRSIIKVFLWVLGAALLITFAVVTGVLVYHQARQKRIEQRLRKVQSMMALDTALSYREGSQVLTALLKEKPNSAKILIARAELEVIRWGRFDGGARAGRLAEESLVQAKRLGITDEQETVVEAYLLLYKDKYDAAARAAERGLVHYPRSARLGYILGVSRLRMGDLEAAEATLRLAVSNDKKFLPAIYEMAVVQRLRGRFMESEALLTKVLQLSPEHVGAKIEMALVNQLVGQGVDETAVKKLFERVKDIPKYAARALLVKSRQNLLEGLGERVLESVSYLKRCISLRPQEPEYLLELLAIHLRPGGDIAKAQRLVGEKLKRVREYPAAPLLQARLALGSGDAEGALKYLSEVRLSSLGSQERALVKAYRVRALLENNEHGEAGRICKGFVESKGDVDALLAMKGVPKGLSGKSISHVVPSPGISVLVSKSEGGRGRSSRSGKIGAEINSGEHKTPDRNSAQGGVGSRSKTDSDKNKSTINLRERSVGKVLEACGLYAYRARDLKMAGRLRKLVKDESLGSLLKGIALMIKCRPIRAWKVMKNISVTEFPGFSNFMGWALQKMGRPRRALSFFAAKFEHEAKGVRSRLDLATAFYRAGELKAARRELDKLQDIEVLSPVLLYDWGRLLFRMGDMENALQLADRLRKDFPESHLGHYLRGQVSLEERQWRRARRSFEVVMELSPEFYKGTLKLAAIAMALKGSEHARALYLKAYRQSKRNPEVLVEMARQFAEDDGDRQTVKAYMHAARAFRKAGSGYRASELYSELAELLSYKKNYNRSKVEAIYKMALRYKYAHHLAYFRRAEYLRRRGKPDEALRWYEKAAAAAPESPDAQYGLAWVLIHLQKNSPLALQSLKRFDELEHGTVRARRVKKMRRRLRYLELKER